MDSLSSCCIHTFRHSDDLSEQENLGGRHTLTEGKAWRTGLHLWAEADRSGERMPILFSAADRHSGVIYWATIDDISIDDETSRTICSYSNLREVKPPKPRSILRLRTGDRPLLDDLIRPYAICIPPLSPLSERPASDRGLTPRALPVNADRGR